MVHAGIHLQKREILITKIYHYRITETARFLTMYDEDYEDYDCYQDYDDNYDYERDTFYALTDGMYGDYDEWRENGGDIGDLMDRLGY